MVFLFGTSDADGLPAGLADSSRILLLSFLLSLVWILLHAAVSAKTFPLAWHLRLLYCYARHFCFARRPVRMMSTGVGVEADPVPDTTTANATATLFQPTLYATATALGELDYSLHKSNSTYLADLDLARGCHFYSLFRQGMRAYASGLVPGYGKGAVFPALGGVTCTFLAEIRPFERVQIWTRVLSWDAKWIYLISHFVATRDAPSPSGYTDQPRRQQGERRGRAGHGRAADVPTVATTSAADATRKPVRAAFISKHVVKQGRKTIRPEAFLQVCGLLPLTLGRSGQMDAMDKQAGVGCGGGGEQSAIGNASDLDGIARQIECRRRRGLVLADHVAALGDGGRDFFPAAGELAFAAF